MRRHPSVALTKCPDTWSVKIGVCQSSRWSTARCRVHSELACRVQSEIPPATLIAMKRLLPSVAIALYLCAPNPAQAQAEKNVAIVVSVAVADACLLKPNALKQEAARVLEQAGHAITIEGEEAEYLFLISPEARPFGNSSQSCIGSVAVQLTQYEVRDDQRFGSVLALQNGSTVMAEQTSNFETQLRNSVREQVSTLANEFLNGRSR